MRRMVQQTLAPRFAVINSARNMPKGMPLFIASLSQELSVKLLKASVDDQ